jgi:hypothetical protein
VRSRLMNAPMHPLKHASLGFMLGLLSTLPVGEMVVTLSAAAMVAVGSGITGFILTQVEQAS